MEGAAMTTVETFISTMSTVITGVIGWLGDILAFFTSNPVVYIPMLMFFIVGGLVGILNRILRG